MLGAAVKGWMASMLSLEPNKAVVRRQFEELFRRSPTAELDRLAFDVFLPIHFQLFVGKSVDDSDLDGVPDDQDNFPSDPTRSGSAPP